MRFNGTPVLAVEILSSNRRTDLIQKTFEHAAASLEHFWIVDPRDEVLKAWLPMPVLTGWPHRSRPTHRSR